MTIELCDEADAFFVSIVGNFLAFIAQTSVHLLPETVEIQCAVFDQLFIFGTRGVDQLHFAASLRTFMVCDNPDVGADARVVKELVGQGYHGFQPVIFNDPSSDIAFSALGGTCKQWRTVKYNGDA